MAWILYWKMYCWLAGCLLLLLSFSFSFHWITKNWPPKSWTALFTNPFINRFREWAHFIYYLFREHLSAVWRGTLTEHVCAAAWLRYCSAGGVQRHASVSVCRWRWTVMRPRHQRGQGLRLGSCMAQILGVLQWHAGCRWGFFQSLIGNSWPVGFCQVKSGKRRIWEMFQRVINDKWYMLNC